MYQVNLLPWRVRQQRRRYVFWLRLFCTQLFVATSILTSIFFLLGHQQVQQRKVVQTLTQQYSDLTVRLREVQQSMSELARVTAAETQRRQNLAHNRRYLSLLQQLSLALPDTLWLTRFEENAKGILLQGVGAPYAAIITFEQQMALSPLLHHSQLAEVMAREEGGLTFILKARWVTNE
ncbi:PilN domain-containing protein [Serratia sp. UGAL515B_01]|uniref:PilN domain-containing protein n=1 Tax=Serratia sp. UGAL515B_01 TaxID=2986763 RepID=UPI00295363AC|nr:PilN domain-containing protein [Serratia sp. UGAL515B_01]WON76743.1 PilN domain-containing protein [Serratia sp. UGAL515B_01]